MKHKGFAITVFCFLFVFSACNSLNLTSTSHPTATLPSSSISTAIPTPLLPDMGPVVASESFDDLDFAFNIYGPARIDAGVLVLEREAGYTPPPDKWPFGGIYGKAPVPAGVTTVILFKVGSGTDFNIGYHTGEYGTESLRRFSFSAGRGVWDLYEGNPAGNGNNPVQTWPAQGSSFEQWHTMSLKRSANGDMDAKLWEQGKPESVFEFHMNLGTEWGTLPLTFFIDYRGGSFLLDEYQELQ